MGFGESGVHIIFFIATIIIASSVSAVLVTTVQKVSLSLKVQGENLEDKIATDFEIVNDPLNIPVNTSTSPPEYTFYIKNTGSKSILLSESTITVLIDGTAVSSSNMRLNPEGNLKPGYLGEVYIKTSLTSGDHTIYIILENGISDSLRFSI